jgi:hypothetical protein
MKADDTARVRIKQRRRRSPLTFHETVQRKIFADFYNLNYTLDDYRKVLWTFEFKIRTFKVSGCMTYQGVGKLVQFDTGEAIDEMRSSISDNYYKTVLFKSVTATMKKQKIDRADCIFQLNPQIYNETIYSWRHQEEFQKLMFGWPYNSKDMHPVRPIINILKAKVFDLYKKNPKLEGNSLWKHIENLWSTIPTHEVQKSIDKIPERMIQVTKNGGNHIRYI